LAESLEEITNHLAQIRGTHYHPKLLAVLSALDAGTRRVLDSLPLPAHLPRLAANALSVSREDAETETRVHETVPPITVVEAERAAGCTGAASPDLKEEDNHQRLAEETKLADEKAEGDKEPKHGQHEVNDTEKKKQGEKEGEEPDRSQDDEDLGSPLEESGSEKSDLGYMPESHQAKGTNSGEGSEEQASVLGVRRKRRLRSRKSIKCRGRPQLLLTRGVVCCTPTTGNAPGPEDTFSVCPLAPLYKIDGEYDETAGEAQLMRSGSEPDSDASEHRSSDASASLGEPLDPSSKVRSLCKMLDIVSIRAPFLP